ncbi:MAG: membrane integrity-associated transporter subunit PqiC [Desulfovibrionales bacterium]|nr:membrane integrity-associated transporter subunit PqiC [Desulfovibrionales bacterium]
MNSRMTLAAVLGLAWVALLTGCAGKAQTISYYSLHVPQASVPSFAGNAVSVSVGPVTLPDILKQTRIATGGEKGQYRMAEYHRWTGEVDRDMARALAERLSRSLGTENVSLFPPDQRLRPRFRVLVDVVAMGGSLGREATLTARWTLLDSAGEGGPLVRRTDAAQALPDAGHASWVAAQQRNVERLADDIAAAITAARN